MSQIILQGLIPISTPSPNYAFNYTISDAGSGKFISLIGARKFYNPGIDLTLASPTSAATSTTLTMINQSNNTTGSILMHSNSGGDSAFVGYPDSSNPTGDIIPGFINRTTKIVEYSNSAPNLTNENSVHPDPTIRLMNVLSPGQYQFKCNGSGTTQWSSTKNFNFSFVWCMNISGQEILLNPIMNVVTQHVGGQADYLGIGNWSVNFTSTIFNLNVGDYIQLYCKSIGAVGGATGSFNITTLEFDIILSSLQPPTQTTFSNPLGLTDFNTSSINFYGGGRDTLILQGTKLTNL